MGKETVFELKKRTKELEKLVKLQEIEIRELSALSERDILTELYNRRGFIREAEKFLKEGDKIKINMVLKGREKAMGDFAKNKIKFFTESLEKLIPIKTERELKREPRGFTAIISKK